VDRNLVVHALIKVAEAAARGGGGASVTPAGQLLIHKERLDAMGTYVTAALPFHPFAAAGYR
jgi:hypothetical protein